MLLIVGDVSTPCPNCFIEQQCPCSGCKRCHDYTWESEVSDLDWLDSEEIEEGNMSERLLLHKIHTNSIWVTAEEMDLAWPTIDFTLIKEGDRVVMAPRDGPTSLPCANCYGHYSPCCETCSDYGVTSARIMTWEQYRSVAHNGNNLPVRFSDYNKLSEDEISKLMFYDYYEKSVFEVAPTCAVHQIGGNCGLRSQFEVVHGKNMAIFESHMSERVLDDVKCK